MKYDYLILYFHLRYFTHVTHLDSWQPPATKILLAKWHVFDESRHLRADLRSEFRKHQSSEAVLNSQNLFRTLRNRCQEFCVWLHRFCPVAQSSFFRAPWRSSKMVVGISPPQATQLMGTPWHLTLRNNLYPATQRRIWAKKHVASHIFSPKMYRLCAHQCLWGHVESWL